MRTALRVVTAVAVALAVASALPDAAPVPTAPAATRVVAPDPVPGTSWHSVRTGDHVRRYLLATPAGPGPHPLLVALHGLGQTTPGFLRTTQLVPAALQAGVSVLAPETPDASWNDGRFGRTGRDDVGFVDGVVDTLVARGAVDPQRVVLAGFSNGAGLSMALMAAVPRRWSGALLVGGELLAAPGTPRPVAAVPVVLVHGTDDPVQPWTGRRARSRRMPAQVGVPATVAAYRAVAEAPSSAPEVALPHVPGRVRVTVQQWTGTTPVTLYRLVGAGHVWPVSSCATGGCRPGHSSARLADVSATRLAVEMARRSRGPQPDPAV